MYIHIGRGTVIRSDDIIALIDKKTVEYQREKNQYFFCDVKMTDLEKGNYRTLIITDTNKYFSPFTTRYFTKQMKHATKVCNKTSNL